MAVGRAYSGPQVLLCVVVQHFELKVLCHQYCRGCAQRFNSFVFSADSLKHKTHPL